ncbi:MAG: small nuclear ribonucleoprotein [Candidatus Altiarchaeales archaeon]|nr:MAG: small nuclear ribonucleoprotein [Candidatus Altiarchaeales archaeon]
MVEESRPIDALNIARGKRILIRLKNGVEISGTLKAHDLHLNMWLEDVEMSKGDEKTKLPGILVRGDTVLYVIP